MIYQKNNNKGYTLTTTLITVAIMVVISMSLLGLMMNQMSSTERYSASMKALYAARRGINVAFTRINRGENGDVSNTINSTTSYNTNFNSGTGLLRSTGTVKSRGRSDEVDIEKTITVILQPQSNKFQESFSSTDLRNADNTTATWNNGQVTSSSALSPIYTFSSGTIADMFFLNDDIGYCTLNIGSGNIQVFKTTDGGESWSNKFTIIKNSGSQQFRAKSIHFINENTGFINLWGQNRGGDDNTRIYKTTDGGDNWQSVWTDPYALANDPLYNKPHYWSSINQVDFPTATTGYAVGSFYVSPLEDKPLFLKTTDGGESWSVLSNGRFNLPWNQGGNLPNYNFFRVSFKNANEGKISYYFQYFSGTWQFVDGYYSTTNGGTTWSRDLTYNAGNWNYQINDLDTKYDYTWYIYKGNLYRNTALRLNDSTAEFVWENTNDGYAVASNVVYITNNAGINWSTVPIQGSGCTNISSSPESNTYWAANNNTIYKSPAVYVNSRAESINVLANNLSLSIRSIKLVPDRTDDLSAPDYNVRYYYSVNNGSNWNEVQPNKWSDDPPQNGTNIRWRANFITQPEYTPVLNHLTIYYTSGYSIDYTTWRTD